MMPEPRSVELHDIDPLLKELRTLNEHLADFKIMLAPYLGYVIKEEIKDA